MLQKRLTLPKFDVLGNRTPLSSLQKLVPHRWDFFPIKNFLLEADILLLLQVTDLVPCSAEWEFLTFEALNRVL